jgi:hypothetical protein
MSSPRTGSRFGADLRVFIGMAWVEHRPGVFIQSTFGSGRSSEKK